MKYEIGNINLLSEQDRNNLIAEAKRCIDNGENYADFAISVGYAEWMDDFTDAAEGESINDEYELAQIDNVLVQAWEAAEQL